MGAIEIDFAVVETLRMMTQGSDRSNAEILDDLTHLKVTEERLHQATALIAELVTRRPYAYATIHLEESAIAASLGRRRPGPLATSWLRRASLSPLSALALLRYEFDQGAARETLDFLNARRPPVNDLERLLRRGARGLLGASRRDVRDPRRCPELLDGLLGQDAKLLAWCRSSDNGADDRHPPWRFDSTLLRCYRWIRRPRFATGWDRLPRDAEARYDLGGGSATADVERLFGSSLVNCDLTPPRRAGQPIERFRVATKRRRDAPFLITGTRLQTGREARRYAKLSERTQWQRFDVLTDSFDDSYRSYCVTSFGFLSAALWSPSKHLPDAAELGPGGLPARFTMYAAIRRVLELVAKGKDVALFSYHRGPGTFMNITIMLRFSAGTLCDQAIYSAPYQLTSPVLSGS